MWKNNASVNVKQCKNGTTKKCTNKRPQLANFDFICMEV